MKTRRYGTADRFRQALEQRIRTEALRSGMLIVRVRQIAVFERFTARLVSAFGSRVVLKGGFALELRLHGARATRDMDLRVSGDPGALLAELQAAGRMDLGDFMTFEIRRDAQHAVIATTSPYQGHRFRGEARLAGKIYGEPFHVDVVSGGLMPRPPDRVTAGEFFGFAGLPPFEVAVYAREVHISEKLHAYTYPYPVANSRVRDLPDLALLARSGTYDAVVLRDTIAAVFAYRATHPVPSKLPSPPVTWDAVYASLAQENALQWHTIDVLFHAVEAFLDPVLAGGAGTWSAETWTWGHQSSGEPLVDRPQDDGDPADS
ncbi:nucleotidyl transferase AbiEii/AbiGii toxin family protein [Sorangium sp. So ce296]|uniref:nucleotidyl transferase AbiEii/AbiGii toxin family protein n=1 Tax=Sorangium sp. So ce296 TaxID=3133296 RepID=UPI003F62EF69